MLIECDSCEVRDTGCGQCVVTALLGVPVAGEVDIGDEELRALDVLAGVGMVPPLRLSVRGARAS
ncbi:hypothetical protein [Actinomadura alba]|uniref:Uncharacterized protein n=1 Tax=Actinomadura alba TaxID=406431 RepID=A0ABR7LLK1_9ACTN|nr:hypothetical protein [Actinomadura alba]MBC6465370.1 hypothetical protein [Actinomadura alba]